MSPSEVVGAEMTSSVPTPTATPPPVMEAPDRLTGELDSIAVILAAKFPTCRPLVCEMLCTKPIDVSPQRRVSAFI